MNDQTPHVISSITNTGFDFGPIGNSVYWIGLVLFAAGLSYILLYYKGGALSNILRMWTRESIHDAAHTHPIAPPHTILETDESHDEEVLPTIHHGTEQVEIPNTDTHYSEPTHTVIPMRASIDTLKIAQREDGTPILIIHRG